MKLQFKEWLLKNEMAHFTLQVPAQKRFSLPSCNDDEPCNKCVVGGMDMKFELWKPGMNTGSQFVGKVPGTDKYIVYHGWAGNDVLTAAEYEQQKDKLAKYTHLDEDWWKYAEVYDYPDLNICKRSMAEETPITQQKPKQIPNQSPSTVSA